MQRFTSLKVWQRAYAFVLNVYKRSQGFPKEERFSLTSQLRRAALSVVANIAEGAKRDYPADYARLLNLAEGSIAEAECLLRLAIDLGFLDAPAASTLLREAEEISRMLYGLRRTVQRTATSRTRSPPARSS